MKARKDLVNAVKAWAAIDSEVSDRGWTKGSESRWEGAKEIMVSLADGLQNQPCKCVVVTIREMDPTYCDDVDTVAFSGMDKATDWIESQIASQVQTFGLDRESAVDGWFVHYADNVALQILAKKRASASVVIVKGKCKGDIQWRLSA